MKHKTETLEGGLLDLAVFLAMAERGGSPRMRDGRLRLGGEAPGSEEFVYEPSRNWEQGGPIIEREGISLMFIGARGWSANFDQHFDEGSQDDPYTGPTPLIAAMRAYVCAKLGDEVELP